MLPLGKGGDQLLLAARTLKVRLALVALVLWTVPAFAQERFAGRVVGITDGDTISVMREGRSVRVRLEGIDCPEKGQDSGQRAKQFTSDMAFAKDAVIEVRDVDRYGRLVARVNVDGEDVSLALVRCRSCVALHEILSRSETGGSGNGGEVLEVGAVEPPGSDPALGVPTVGAPPSEPCSISLIAVSVRSFGTSTLSFSTHFVSGASPHTSRRGQPR